ncbi:MAG: putative RNA methyltransferase [Thermoleophilia bacterium]
MNGASLAALACPVCRRPLAEVAAALRCQAGHSFDIAREGHVTLLPGDVRPGGDTREMVAARAAFLAAGHLAPLNAAIDAAAAAALAHDPPGVLLDLGAGTGHHLARLLDARPERAGVALDASRAAARRAARAHPRLAAVVCDVWRGLPVRDGSAALVLDAFAPRNAREIARALAPEGRLLVVTPTAAHMAELVEALGLLTVDPRKPERMSATLGAHLERGATSSCEFAMELSHADVRHAAVMGPSAHHIDRDELAARIAALPRPMRVTASATVATYRPY